MLSRAATSKPEQSAQKTLRWTNKVPCEPGSINERGKRWMRRAAFMPTLPLLSHSIRNTPCGQCPIYTYHFAYIDFWNVCGLFMLFCSSGCLLQLKGKTKKEKKEKNNWTVLIMLAMQSWQKPSQIYFADANFVELCPFIPLPLTWTFSRCRTDARNVKINNE